MQELLIYHVVLSLVIGIGAACRTLEYGYPMKKWEQLATCFLVMGTMALLWPISLGEMFADLIDESVND